jgi:hypothetical protein
MRKRYGSVSAVRRSVRMLPLGEGGRMLGSSVHRKPNAYAWDRQFQQTHRKNIAGHITALRKRYKLHGANLTVPKKKKFK